MIKVSLEQHMMEKIHMISTKKFTCYQLKDTKNNRPHKTHMKIVEFNIQRYGFQIVST